MSIDFETERCIRSVSAEAYSRPAEPGERLPMDDDGVRGGVRLESIVVGGQRFTSIEAIGRFIERTTANSRALLLRPRPTSRQGEAAIRRAERELRGWCLTHRTPKQEEPRGCSARALERSVLWDILSRPLKAGKPVWRPWPVRLHRRRQDTRRRSVRPQLSEAICGRGFLHRLDLVLPPGRHGRQRCTWRRQ